MMMGEQLRFGSGAIRKVLLQDLGDPRMKLLALTLQQPSISSVLNQRVLEGVGGKWEPTAPEDQLRALELSESLLQLLFGKVRNCSKQIIRELPAQSGAKLCRVFGQLQAVQPR